MDHLPLPSSPYDAHVDVIVRTDKFIDHVYSPPWNTFHERSGYLPGELESFAGAKLDPGSLSRLAAFCQKWLFFGLIAEFLGVEFKEEEWTSTRQEDGVQIVSTSALLPRLESWRLNMMKLLPSDKLHRTENLTRLLNEVDHYLITLTFSYDFENNSDLLPLDLSLSLSALHETLAVALRSALEGSTVNVSSHGGFPNLTQRLLSNGWCRSDIHRVHQNGGILTKYYTSRLGKLPVWRDHSECSIELCFAGRVDSDTYETKHVVDSCNCKSVGIPTEKIANAIDNCDTPLVMLETTSDGDILTLSTKTSYTHNHTAISHVWAEGLGNPFRNQLPMCQLKRIQNCVNAVYGSSNNKPFWMDTLCIPVGKKYRSQRTRAIAGMVNIYQEAKSVLILSKELANISTCTTMLELVARTARILWFRRLWTLQEGILPPHAFFQFEDAPISMQALLESSNQYGCSVEDALHRHLHRELLSPISDMDDFKQTRAEERIKHIWSAVQWRITSIAEDETVCLAAMLSLDARPMLQFSRGDPDVAIERMKVFILHQKYFPTASLFQPDDDGCMQAEGFRWAPKSFVFRTAKPMDDVSKSPLALADERGLHVSLPGLKVQNQDLKKMPYRFHFLISQDWDHYYRASAMVMDDKAPWVEDPALLNSGHPMIVLENDTFLTMDDCIGPKFQFDKIEDRGGFTRDNKIVDVNGLLVVVTDQVDEEMQAIRVVRMKIVREAWRSSRRSAYKQYWDMLSAETKPEDFVYLDVLPGFQRWCIG